MKQILEKIIENKKIVYNPEFSSRLNRSVRLFIDPVAVDGYNYALDDIKSLLPELLSTIDSEITLLIAKEINIAHSENQPTSRLTSLAIKIKELLR